MTSWYTLLHLRPKQSDQGWTPSCLTISHIRHSHYQCQDPSVPIYSYIFFCYFCSFIYLSIYFYKKLIYLVSYYYSSFYSYTYLLIYLSLTPKISVAYWSFYSFNYLLIYLFFKFISFMHNIYVNKRLIIQLINKKWSLTAATWRGDVVCWASMGWWGSWAWVWIWLFAEGNMTWTFGDRDWMAPLAHAATPKCLYLFRTDLADLLVDYYN